MEKDFEEAHKRWLERHLRLRQGGRLGRLREGHAYLEILFLQNIWWPAFGTLDELHPEYEVRDYNDGLRYIDHAYKPGLMKLALEADGFNPHIRDVGRWEHADNLLRDAHLAADGWTVLHFSSDVIKYRPRQAQQLLRQIVWGREGREQGELSLSLEGREALRFARRNKGILTSKALGVHLNRSRNTVRKVMIELIGAGFIRPLDKTKKVIHVYELTPEGRELVV